MVAHAKPKHTRGDVRRAEVNRVFVEAGDCPPAERAIFAPPWHDVMPSGALGPEKGPKNANAYARALWLWGARAGGPEFFDYEAHLEAGGPPLTTMVAHAAADERRFRWARWLEHYGDLLTMKQREVARGVVAGLGFTRLLYATELSRRTLRVKIRSIEAAIRRWGMPEE